VRILLLIKRFHVGGAERHVSELANQLFLRKHEVSLMAGNGYQRKKLMAGIHYKKQSFREITALFHLFTLIRFIKKNNIEIVHAHQRLPIFLASLVGVLCKVPVVATVHGRPKYDLRSSFVQKSLAAIVFVSHHVLNISSLPEKIKNKSRVIPNGIHRTERTVLEIPFRISYASRIDKRHANLLLMMIHQVLPRLIRQYPQLTFYVYGRGKKNDMVDAAMRRMNRLEGREVCRFMGLKENLDEHIQQSSLVIGVGRVAIEALAQGIPVLLVNLHHLGFLPGHGQYDFLRSTNFVDVNSPPPEPDTLEKSINDFFKNQALWKAETLHLQRLILRDLSWDTLILQVEQIYASALHVKANSHSHV
jgi:glycosyltransferase involved in cell wall biosynthesis